MFRCVAFKDDLVLLLGFLIRLDHTCFLVPGTLVNILSEVESASANDIVTIEYG